MNRQIIAGLFIALIILMTLYVIQSGFVESFAMPTTLNLGFKMCGVDMPSCTNGTRCINGYCTSPTEPIWPEKSDLPLRGPTFSPDGEEERYNRYTR
jgi:hypothetical protein